MEADATPNASQPKTRRRWFNFSLRTVLIFVTLAGCGMAWLGFKVQEGRRQAAAVAAIEKLGGWVQYDYQVDSQGGFVPNATPPGPAWLHSLLGDGFFRKVYCVSKAGYSSLDIEDRPFRDADLELVKGLTTLKMLSLLGTQVSDAGLEHLRGLTTLKSLNLYNLQVTDAGLANLTGLTRLEELDLGNTHVSDAGLDYLKRLTRLEELDLGNTQVGDAGLVYLEGLTHLKSLDVRNTHVTNEGVAQLQQALPDCHISR